MDSTPAQRRIASVAAEWAAEVVPRLRSIAASPTGSALEKFTHHLRGEDPANQLTIIFYLAIEETLAQSLPWRPGATALEEGEPLYLGRLIKWLIADTQVVAAPFLVQRQAIPEDFVRLADEIALEFAERLRWFKPGGFLHGLLMERQLAALTRVADWLESFSGQTNAEFWTDQALQSAPQWSRARELAKEALAIFAIDTP